METLRVLFIDDSQDDVQLVNYVLNKEFYVIWKRIETESALVISMEDKWDVIICDYVLPRFRAERALEVVKDFVAKHPLRALPFVVISGLVDETTAIDLLRKGASDFISKDKLQRLPLAIRRELRQVDRDVKKQLHIEDSYDATIEAWGKALELRDIYTKGHTERVTTCALRFAVKLNVSRQDFVNINRGSLLHDIGKIGIPDAILLKQDALTIDEMNTMKMHPILAFEMLRNIPFLQGSIDIPYCHHERWNGSGYPQGLMGTDIPFNARLFAIVDVYDALTSDRPYRKSWDKARVIDYLLGEKNITFDSYLIDEFVDMVGRG